MKDFNDTNACLSVPALRPRFIRFIVISVLVMFAFVLSACGTNLVSTDATSVVQASTPLNTTGYPVKVFFSQNPGSFNSFSAVYPVERMSPTVAVATFSIQLLIAGPTLSERHAGYFSELNTMLSGPSNCSAPIPVGGPDFVLTLNMKGTVSESGTATLKFCRSLNSAGIGADARVQAEITATLKQFPDIKKVVILTMDGHCFADESGKDFCLR